MTTIRDSVDVNVPISTVYNQWAHFEDFPHFMEGIEEVRKLGQNRYHWRAKVAGKREEWDAEVTEDVPERRIAWRSVSGPRNDGVVEFEPISSTATRIHLRMDYEPQGAVEKIGDMLGADKRRVHGDLEHFKDYVEQHKGLM